MFDKFLKNMIVDPSIELRRAAGQCIGMLARVEGDHFANQMVKNLIQLVRSTSSLDNDVKVQKSKDANAITGIAFALGCIKRYSNDIQY